MRGRGRGPNAVCVLAVGLLLAATAAAARAGGRVARAAACVRVVGSSVRLAAAPLVLTPAASTLATGTGEFTVTNPGQAGPWFLTLRAEAPPGVHVMLRPESSAAVSLPASRAEARLAWAPGGVGGGRFQVQTRVEVTMPGPGVPPLRLTASVTSGP